MSEHKSDAIDRRSEPRHKVSISGWISLAEGLAPLQCQLLDLSVSGARVMLKNNYQLPNRVKLFESQNGNTFDCTVRWQEKNIAGLHFIDLCSRSARRDLIAAASAVHVRKKRV